MKLIPLVNTIMHFARVDDEDYARVMTKIWRSISNHGKPHQYAKASSTYGNGPLLHRFVMHIGKGNKIILDHQDRDGLNCQKGNLVESTIKDNSENRDRTEHSSGHLRVYFDKRYNKFNPYSTNINGVRKSLGWYDTIEAAIKARDTYDKQITL